MVADPIFRLIGEAADELGQEAFVVGGYVRDGVMGRPQKNDLDFVTVGSGIALAEKVAKKTSAGKVHVFRNFGTAMIRLEDFELEFVGARKESYDRGSRKPTVEEGSLEDDQNRRDFTVNALAIQLNASSFGQLLDPFDGIRDIAEERIRTPLDPDLTYSDDPLRMRRPFASPVG